VKSFHPEVANCLKDIDDQLFVYFEIYSQSDKDQQFDVSYKIKRQKGKDVAEKSYKRRKDGTRTMEFFPLMNSQLSQGIYEMELKVKTGFRGDDTKKQFFIRWADMPSTITDIDLAIRQVKYIADKAEYDKLKKASADEKLEKFEAFWRENDPTPGTQANEWMDEFYRRVQFTNEAYTVFREGWKSDMGMIYIIFGPPNDIERHPFALETKPHEIWYYHEINKEFVFMDLAGFGEYRLMTTGWEAWRSSIRNF
jgi:GWxTD domain-containing protein